MQISFYSNRLPACGGYSNSAPARDGSSTKETISTIHDYKRLERRFRRGGKTSHAPREKQPRDAGVNAPRDRKGVIHFTLSVAEESIQQKAVVYDRAGDAYYDTISGFIKSMRVSDEKGAMYWLAKMLHAGEDFRFIARRNMIFASEDVGLADPDALRLAIATQQAVEFVGMSEARIPLAHATAYMCRAAKSREAYDELNAAIEKIEMEQTKQVPERLKNKHFPVNPKS